MLVRLQSKSLWMVSLCGKHERYRKLMQFFYSEKLLKRLHFGILGLEWRLVLEIITLK